MTHHVQLPPSVKTKMTMLAMITPLRGMTPLSMLPVEELQLQAPLYQLLEVRSLPSHPVCGHRIFFQEFSRCIFKNYSSCYPGAHYLEKLAQFSNSSFQPALFRAPKEVPDFTGAGSHDVMDAYNMQMHSKSITYKRHHTSRKE